MRFRNWVVIGLSLLLFSSCDERMIDYVFYVGVIPEGVIYGIEPDRVYKTTKVVFNGQTLYPGESDTIIVLLNSDDTKFEVSVSYDQYNNSDTLLSSDVFTPNIYVDDGNYVAVLGISADQYYTLDEMNSDLSDKGFSTTFTSF